SRAGHRPLLIVQTMLSVLLLAGAGMLGRSLWNLMAQDFGFRMDDVLLVEFEPGPHAAIDENGIFLSALERIRVLPRVEAASIMQSVPSAGHNVPPISVPGRAEPPQASNGQLPFLVASTPELMSILGIEIVEGRALTAADDRGAPVVV